MESDSRLLVSKAPQLRLLTLLTVWLGKNQLIHDHASKKGTTYFELGLVLNCSSDWAMMKKSWAWYVFLSQNSLYE
jgi:hypothetical protein